MAAVITPGPISQMPVYTLPLTGDERLPIIVPVTTNASAFQNYGLTITQFVAAIQGLLAPATFITSGATTGSPYAVTSTDVQILVNKTVSAATGILLPDSTTRQGPILVKDLKGDAFSFNITVTFAGGQTCDGLSSYVITLPYGFAWFYPLEAGGWFNA